jgi:microcystin-dependent protein
MGLESATYIDSLVTTNPIAGDGMQQGDDHLRLLKTTIKASFPNVAFARYLEQDRVDVVNSATPNLWVAASNYCNLLGSTAKTGFAAGVAGQTKLIRIDEAVVLTHNATTLDLPTAADVAAAAGDHMLVVCRGTTSNIVLTYFRANGSVITESFPPIGAMYSWPTDTAPANHMARDGSAISRTTYATLFALIGTKYGVGDGVTTFNLPNHMGAFERNAALGSTRDPDRATRTDRGDGTTGDHVGTWQISANLSHTHTGTTGTESTNHTHPYSWRSTYIQFGGGSTQGWVGESVGTTGYATTTHTHNFTSASSGGTESRPANVSVLPIIRVS